MEKEKFKLIVGDKTYDMDDTTLNEIVERIKAQFEKCTKSIIDNRNPPLTDYTIERIMSRFIICEENSGKEYDGSGFPIKGKYVLSVGEMMKDLEAVNLDEAIQYLYAAAEKECEWLRMVSKSVDPDEVINGYTIINTKTAKTYDRFGVEQ